MQVSEIKATEMTKKNVPSLKPIPQANHGLEEVNSNINNDCLFNKEKVDSSSMINI